MVGGGIDWAAPPSGRLRAFPHGANARPNGASGLRKLADGQVAGEEERQKPDGEKDVQHRDLP